MGAYAGRDALFGCGLVWLVGLALVGLGLAGVVFLARPARYLELRARLRALLRRTDGFGHNRVLRVGPLTIDSHAHAASLRNMHFDLRQMEYNLLVHLASDPRRVFRKQELLRAVWGYKAPGSTRTLDSHASRLRRKLAAQGERWVINVRGVGFRLL